MQNLRHRQHIFGACSCGKELGAVASGGSASRGSRGRARDVSYINDDPVVGSRARLRVLAKDIRAANVVVTRCISQKHVVVGCAGLRSVPAGSGQVSGVAHRRSRAVVHRNRSPPDTDTCATVLRVEPRIPVHLKPLPLRGGISAILQRPFARGGGELNGKASYLMWGRQKRTWKLPQHRSRPRLGQAKR